MATGVVKTRAQLLYDLDAGELLEGTYDPGPRPIPLFGARCSAIGHPVRRATILSTGGTSLLAAFCEPTPPAAMWTTDGGLRLTDPKGRPWRIGFPLGYLSFPGKPPRFWGGLTRAEWTMDFALANYSGVGGTAFPLFGINARSYGASPILVTVQGAQLVVQVRDADGLKRLFANVLDGSPGARNKVTVTIAAGGLAVIGPKGSAALPLRLPLGENVDGVFHVNCAAGLMYDDPMMAPGDLTVYGLKFTCAPAQFSAAGTYAVSLPAAGDWWCPPGGILYCAADVRDHWATPMIRIANLDITAIGGIRDGAGIMVGSTQHDVWISDVECAYHHAGLSNLALAYTVLIDRFRARLNTVASLSMNRAIVRGREFASNRASRDGFLLRGGELSICGGMLVPAGNSADPTSNRQTSFRFPPFEDPLTACFEKFMVDDEGTWPTMGHIAADASACLSANGMRLTFRDCPFAQGDVIAQLTGSNKVAGRSAYLHLENQTSLTAAPKVFASAAWAVDGQPIGMLPVTPVPPLALVGTAVAP